MAGSGHRGDLQENNTSSARAGLMLGHRRRRWTNIKPARAERMAQTALELR